MDSTILLTMVNPITALTFFLVFFSNLETTTASKVYFELGLGLCGSEYRVRVRIF